MRILDMRRFKRFNKNNQIYQSNIFTTNMALNDKGGGESDTFLNQN